VLLLWLNLGWFGMLLLVVILGAYEWVLARLEAPGDDDARESAQQDFEQSPTGE
jgi:hypothetical protein